jgi:hypothetical protein
MWFLVKYFLAKNMLETNRATKRFFLLISDLTEGLLYVALNERNFKD